MGGQDRVGTDPAEPPPLRYRIADYLYQRIGRRGALLIILAAMDFTYGMAMLVTYGAPQGDRAPRWWPASAGVLTGIPVPAWGAIWVAIGLFLLTGVPRRSSDRLQFAIAEALKVWWACSALLYWQQTGSSGSWGPAAIYAGIAALVLMCAGWQDSIDPEDLPSRRRRR